MHALRRYRLSQLLSDRFKGSRGEFLKATGYTKGRLSQLLDPTQPFGDNAARNLEDRLKLDPGFFDTLDARTLHFAMTFESLPPNQKDKWEELVSLLTGATKP